MNRRLRSVVTLLAVIGVVLPLGIAQAVTANCNPATDLYGCIVQGGNQAHGLRVEHTAPSGTGIIGYATSATTGTTIGLHGRTDATEGLGVYGQAAAANGLGIGVKGYASSARGEGVEGVSDSGIGVAARSTSGTGLLAVSGTGFAVRANGTTTQNRAKGGWVKALVKMAGGTLRRCYNSQAANGTAAETCNGFSIAGGAGNYTVTLPFQVNDRFVMVTPESVANSPRCCMVQYDFPAPNQVRVRTWDHNGTAIDRAFSLAIF